MPWFWDQTSMRFSSNGCGKYVDISLIYLLCTMLLGAKSSKFQRARVNRDFSHPLRIVCPDDFHLMCSLKPKRNFIFTVSFYFLEKQPRQQFFCVQFALALRISASDFTRFWRFSRGNWPEPQTRESQAYIFINWDWKLVWVRYTL